MQDADLTQQAVDAATDVAPYVGAAATALIVDHFLGMIGILFQLAIALWVADMLGGTVRALVRGYREGGAEGLVNSWNWEKAVEGVGKLIAMGLAVIVFGAFELAQIEITEKVVQIEDERALFVPMVAPALGVFMVAFSVSIFGQIKDLAPMVYAPLRKIAKKGIPGFEEASQPQDGEREAE